MEEKKARKRLIVWICEKLHREIKTRAAFRGINLKSWIEIAIAQRIEEEKKYE